MNGSKVLWTLAVSVVGGAMLGGCGKPQPIVMQVQAGGKIFLRPKKGDVVQWKDANSHPVAVTFPVPGMSPCHESATTLDTCTVDKEGNVFPYICDGCADPAVAPGSDTGPLEGLALKAQGTVNNAQAGYLYCDPSSHAPKVYKDPLTAADGDKIQWFPGPNMATWQITLQLGTCAEPVINQAQQVCTVQPSAPKKQTYSITADGCTGTGSAGLTIK
jgi:hypothetical protein